MSKTNKNLLILAFDHRGTFVSKLFGGKNRGATPQEAEKIKEFKSIIFDGFLKALELEQRVPREQAGALVDEQFGADVLRRAKKAGVCVLMPVEKSGQDEFDFEYPDWKKRIETFSPTYAKVLVRYNPDGDPKTNRIQFERLRLLNDHLEHSPTDFLFELLVPATERQLKSVGNSADRYDLELRPGLTRKAMEEIQRAGVLPDIWKMEGLDRAEDTRAVVAQAKSTRKPGEVVILGRGAGPDKVRHWLEVAVGVPGVVGFAVGRTIFWDPIKLYHEGKSSRVEAVEAIAKNYLVFADLWLSARSGPSSRQAPPRKAGTS
jgi:5-dehydro-2-deoxygluconokinase